MQKVPPPHCSNVGRSVPARELQLALDASAQIECLVALARGEVHASGGHATQEGTILDICLKQIRRLNSVAMAVVNGGGGDFDAMYREVHDERSPPG